MDHLAARLGGSARSALEVQSSVRSCVC
jgi:hypothetical protein